MRLFSSSSLLLLAGLLVTAAPAHAQIVQDSRTKNWATTYGGSSFGGSCSASANMTRSYVTGQPGFSNFTSSAFLKADVKVFGANATVARVDLSGENAPYTFTGSGTSYTITPIPSYVPSTDCTLQVLGLTVWTPGPFSAGSFAKTWSLPVWTVSTPSVSASFSLLGIPITVSAYASAKATIGFTVSASLSTSSLSAGGFALASASGNATAGVGFSWASAGVKVSLTFGAPRLDLGVNASLFGISGTFKTTMPGIQLVLDLYAKLFKKTKTMNIYTWNLTAMTPYIVNF